jgi:hypothetical protein
MIHHQRWHSFKRIIFFWTLLGSFSTLNVFAQLPFNQRTKEHEKLNVFVGKWRAEGKVYPGEGRPPIEVYGEPAFEWTMHRMWLMFKSGGGRLQGHGYATWDGELKKYVFFWFDNLVTKPTEYHGDWQDAQTLVFNGEVHLRGEIVFSRLKWEVVSANEMNMVREVSVDGKNLRVNGEWVYTKEGSR